jgi:hypothetical protein
MSIIFKDNAKVHIETADYMIVMRKEQREEFRVKLLEKIKEAKWTITKDTPYTHHMLAEVHHI